MTPFPRNDAFLPPVDGFDAWFQGVERTQQERPRPLDVHVPTHRVVSEVPPKSWLSTGSEAHRCPEPRMSSREGGQMRKKGYSIGAELRRNRRAAGHTQEGLAFRLGVNRNTIGEWERNEVLPSPTNMRALRRIGLLDAPAGSRLSRGERGETIQSPELTDRIIEAFGCQPSELQLQITELGNIRECAAVAFLRRLTVEQQEAALTMISFLLPPPPPPQGREFPQVRRASACSGGGCRD